MRGSRCVLPLHEMSLFIQIIFMMPLYYKLETATDSATKKMIQTK